MKNMIILHGGSGIKVEAYFPWLATECEKLGLDVIIPEIIKEKDNSDYNLWHDEFKRQNIPVTENTIVFAQSRSTNFFVKYCAQNNLSLGAYISCAGFVRQSPCNTNPYKETFNPTKQEFEKFKAMPFPKFSIYSDNDMFFEQVALEQYADAVRAQHVFLPGRGHFNIPAGVYEIPEAIEIIEKLIQKSRVGYE